MIRSTRLFGDGKHGQAERIGDLSRSCLPHHLHGPAPSPSLPFETPLPCRVAVVLTALARGLDPSEAPRVAGLPTSDHHEPFSLAGSHAQTLHKHSHLATSSSHTCRWTNCGPGCAAPHRCSGWRSIPSRALLPVLELGPAHNTWPICSSTLCDRPLPPFCLPVF